LNITATHCKVHCGKEFRRFLLPSSQFEALSTQVRTLFGFTLDEPISIKYTDEEGDMVTISSDEELKFAIELFAGGFDSFDGYSTQEPCLSQRRRKQMGMQVVRQKLV